MTEPTTAHVALGSNLGDRRAAIDAALDAIGALPQTRLVTSSSVRETAPVGPIEQPAYLNAAVVIHTLLTPRDLLDSLLGIERSLGRDRASEQRWGPRTLDLDLLLYGDAVIEEPGLIVPHPRLHERAFVLEPLAEVAPDVIVPGLGRRVAELLDAVRPAESANR